MTQPNKKPRYPANPDAPKFTPEVWIAKGSKTEEDPKGLAVSSNCYQYAVSGTDKAGNNIVYDEVSPNPGETKGHLMTPDSYDKKGIKVLSSMDGLEIGSTNHKKLPPNKAGKYIVAAYVENLATAKNPDGDKDYHFIRQDSDGGWSEKQGLQNIALVQRYHEPAADGGYVTLPKKYGHSGSYKFVAYAYVPKQGIDGGMDAFFIPSILANKAYGHDGCAMPNSYFSLITEDKNNDAQNESMERAKKVGEAMKKHGITVAVEAYEACFEKFYKDLLSKRPKLLTPTPDWP